MNTLTRNTSSNIKVFEIIRSLSDKTLDDYIVETYIGNNCFPILLKVLDNTGHEVVLLCDHGNNIKENKDLELADIIVFCNPGYLVHRQQKTNNPVYEELKRKSVFKTGKSIYIKMVPILNTTYLLCSKSRQLINQKTEKIYKKTLQILKQQLKENRLHLHKDENLLKLNYEKINYNTTINNNSI